MKPFNKAISHTLRFVTVWIFARMKLPACGMNYLNGFVTIWIFARMKPQIEDDEKLYGFVTILIFARMKLFSRP